MVEGRGQCLAGSGTDLSFVDTKHGDDASHPSFIVPKISIDA
jgi:hypothetical protein